MNHLLPKLRQNRTEDRRPLRRTLWRLGTSALCSAAIMLAASAAPAAAEVWKDGSGKFQVEAEFLGIRGTDLYLKKPNGMTIKVPLARLSAESQQLARQLAMPAAPAAPAAGDTPDAAARALQASMEAGELRAVWDALPSSYQRDVNDLVHMFAANMDADLWRSGTGLVRKAIRVLKEKKEFILQQPALAASPVDTTAMIENWDPIVGVLETIAASDLADLEKLKTLDVGVFLDGTGKKIAEQLAALAKAADDKKLSLTEFPGVPVDAMPLAGIGSAKFSTVKIEGDTATLRIENDGKTEEEEVVRVDGKWLPKKMVDQWSEQMQSAKTALTTQMPESLKKNKMAVVVPMQMILGVLDQLLATKTQAEFDQVIQQVMQTFAPQGPGAPPAGDAPPAADPFGQ
ncbi:MAG: SHD1 domain-containing protein [Pirellulaceae bacterium]|nr:SHD1 domain-containing protein [Pirellulaceae bacterium]